MRKTYCDICGEVVPEFEFGMGVTRFPLVSMCVTASPTDTVKTYDLCNSCSQKMYQYILKLETEAKKERGER